MFHCLKISPEYFQAVVSGRKSFEVRLNDRDFMVGDHLCLEEWAGYYSGRSYTCDIIYILRDFIGLRPGFVVLGFRR